MASWRATTDFMKTRWPRQDYRTLATRFTTMGFVTCSPRAMPAESITRTTAKRSLAPIFVLGLPRTGTTAMQRLLMADPKMQGLEY